MKKLIDVTAAILNDNGKIMICQRPAHKSCGGLWEFPGGKKEDGESLEQAIGREMKEELDLTLSDIRFFQAVENPDAGIRLNFFKAKADDQTPVLKEHSAIAWILPEQIKDYSFCPSDTLLLKTCDLHDLFSE